MKDAFFKLYEEELRHIREMGADFCSQYPGKADRLGLNPDGCDDPFVERMIEGFAFLAARVRTRLDSEYGNFAESLLESVYPQMMAPLPSMTIIDITPDDKLTGPFLIPRGSVLTSDLSGGKDTRCEFRTAHDVMLQPLRISTTEPPSYYDRDLDVLRLPQSAENARAAITLRICHVQPGKAISSVEDLRELTLHIAGNMDESGAIYEELCAHCTQILLRSVPSGMVAARERVIDLRDGSLSLTPLGFSPAEALLPVDARTFDGYRLLREYGVLPQRFMFLKVAGQALARFTEECGENAFDVIFLLDRTGDELARFTKQSSFRLYATPAINLFERRTDLIPLTEQSDRAHVIVDRSRPLDYEIHQILEVFGSGERLPSSVRFQPFYRRDNDTGADDNFYTVHRERRTLTRREIREGLHRDYLGSEVFLHLVDSSKRVFGREIAALKVRALCTNRHLPLTMPYEPNSDKADLVFEAGVPVGRVKCLIRPTFPIHSPTEGRRSWDLINQLSLNYLSLTDGEEGAAALRSILDLSAMGSDDQSFAWSKALRNVSAVADVRRRHAAGPVSFVRGLVVTLTLDDVRLARHSPYTLGAVMARFLTRYVSINSFVETVVVTSKRGEIGRWPGTMGTQPTL